MGTQISVCEISGKNGRETDLFWAWLTPACCRLIQNTKRSVLPKITIKSERSFALRCEYDPNDSSREICLDSDVQDLGGFSDCRHVCILVHARFWRKNLFCLPQPLHKFSPSRRSAKERVL